jgi:ATP synthase I subunit
LTDVAEREERHYVGAVRRIYGYMVVVGVCGAVVAAYYGGLRWGVGFLLGAAISAMNFRWLHRLVDSIGPDPKTKPSSWLTILLSFRYVILGLVGYVIVRYFRVDIMAALLGLFVAVAAVLIEIIYELIYART